jgi:tripartite-type tricarboxylate transporter receptor subunit TctC
MKQRRCFVIVNIAAAVLLSAPAVVQADVFPSKPITLVVPYTAGGSADIIARTLSKAVGEILKQPVVVDNKPGAAGMIGAGAVAKAAADGHTLLLATDNLHSINPSLYGKSAREMMANLVPVIHLAEAPLVLVVNNGIEVKNFEQLIELARKRSEGLTYATPGIGTDHHLLGELIAKTAHAKLTHVPYKGAASSLSDLAGGQVDMLITLASTARPVLDNGKARIIAVASRGPYSALPQVPTVEQTLKGVNMVVSYGVMAPANTPEAVLRKINEAFQKAMDRPEARAKYQEVGYSGTGGPAEYYARRINEERQQREPIIKEAGIKAE